MPREIYRNNTITKPRESLQVLPVFPVFKMLAEHYTIKLFWVLTRCIVDIMHGSDDYFVYPLRQKTRDDSPQRSFEYPFYDIFSGCCG
ncbi:hypothetical protein WN48_02419 [Eufriesea mexicana]|nr:hypothetical protein WN48_02419 [Eufriesea mexicana]